MTRNRMLAGFLAALFALGGVACEVEDFEDPMTDEPIPEEEGFGEEQDDL